MIRLLGKYDRSPRRDIDLREVRAAIPLHRRREVFRGRVQPGVSSKLFLITVENDPVLSRFLHADTVVGVRIGRVQVEDEQQACALKDDDAVGLVLESKQRGEVFRSDIIAAAGLCKDSRDVGLRRAKPLVLSLSLVHSLVPRVKVPVAQQVIVDEVELPASVHEAVAVAFTREVQPFRVAKFLQNQR